jgi:hypothetical protein
VTSVYQQMIKDDNVLVYQSIWKGKIPLKIKIFTWLVAQQTIPT